MNPAMILAWVQVVAEVGNLASKLAELGSRLQNGEPVTPEELAALKAQSDQAVARWDAAAPNDKKEN